MKASGRVGRTVETEIWLSVSWSMGRYSSGDSHYCVVRAPFRFLGFGFVSESGFQLHHKNTFFIVWTRFQKVKLATQQAEFAFPWELWSRVSWASRAVLVEFCAQHSSDVAFSTFRFLKRFVETLSWNGTENQNGNIWSEPGVGGGEGAALRTSFATFSAKHLLRLQVWNLKLYNFIEPVKIYPIIFSQKFTVIYPRY